MAKARLNLSLDRDLVEFAKVFARENRTTVADMVTQYLLALQRQAAGEATQTILSNPAFHQAIVEARARLQDGTARWHSFDETFG